jgi:thiol-disulfide isomerase/thioredoxin
MGNLELSYGKDRRIMKSSSRIVVAAFAVTLLAWLAGCKGKSPAKTETPKKTGDPKTVAGGGKTQPDGKNPAVAAKPFEPPKAVELKDTTPKELQAFVEKHKGHVVLVDYWFVDCAPCRIAFPHTVELSTKHAKDGLMVVTMCVDEPGNRARAEKFLKSQDAKLVNFFASEKLDPDNLGVFGVESFPTYRLYGADGKFVGAYHGGEELDTAVKTALGH